MKILFLRSNPVNPDSRVEKEVLALVSAGYEVEIFAWDRSKNYSIKTETLKLENNEVKIYRVGILSKYGSGFKKNIFPLLKFQKSIYEYLKSNNNYDAIHACDFDTGFVASLIARKYKITLVYDIFDYYVDSFSVPKLLAPFIEFLEHSVINYASATILCSEKRAEQIEGSKPKKLVFIHNTPSKISSRKEIKLSYPIKIAYIGVLSEGRLIEELVDIVANDKNYYLDIAGFGPLEQLVREKSEKNNNIEFHGKIPYNETLSLENEAQILIAVYNPEIANHVYAAPNKFYEALMLGRPLIMALNTGMSEYIEEYDIGELITYDKAGLKSGLDQLTSRIDEWKEISSRMKNIYDSNFSWEVMSERLIDLYNSL